MANSENGKTNEWQLKQQEKINEIAREYYESVSEKKIALRNKLIDKLWLYALKIDDDTENVNDLMLNELEKRERKSEKATRYKDHFNTEVVMEAIEFCIDKYVPSEGNIVHLFNRTYMWRNRDDYADKIERKNNRGFSQSVADKKRLDSLKKYIDAQSKEDDRFAGKTIDDFDTTELQEFLSMTTSSPKEVERLIDVIQKRKQIRGNTSSWEQLVEKNMEKDSNNLDLQEQYDICQSKNRGESYDDDVVEIDTADEQRAQLKNIFKGIFERANKNQKKYFSCFVVQDLFNAKAISLKEAMLPFINQSFWDFVEQLNLGGKVADKVVADFLKVQAPAVSKKRAAYDEMRMEELNQ